MIAMVLSDPVQRATLQADIAAWCRDAGIYCAAIGDDSGSVTQRWQTPEEIAQEIIRRVAGSIGLTLSETGNVNVDEET